MTHHLSICLVSMNVQTVKNIEIDWIMVCILVYKVPLGLQCICVQIEKVNDNVK